MNISELLARLSGLFGPSGREERVADAVREYLSPYADEIYSDALGNLICRKKGAGKKLLLSAPLDEPGFMITGEDKGYSTCHFFGGCEPSDFAARRVVTENGEVGTAAVRGGKKEGIGRGDIFIDLCGKTAETGTLGTLFVVPETSCDGAFLTGKALASRAAAAALSEAFRLMKTECDVYAVFTVRHFTESRGARAVSGGIKADEALALGFVSADDVPGGEGHFALGKGVFSSVRDKKFIAAKSVRDKLTKLGAAGLALTEDVNSDAHALAEYGTPTGALLIPVRYVGTASECVALSDVSRAAELLRLYAEN